MKIEGIKNKLKKFLNPKFLFKKILDFFSHSGRALFLVIALLMTIVCIYFWYTTIYHSEWNDAQIQEYKKNKNEGTNFEQKNFEYNIGVIDSRRTESQKDLENLTDIFRLKKSSGSLQIGSNEE